MTEKLPTPGVCQCGMRKPSIWQSSGPDRSFGKENSEDFFSSAPIAHIIFYLLVWRWLFVIDKFLFSSCVP